MAQRTAVRAIQAKFQLSERRACARVGLGRSADLQVAAAIGYALGWRMQSEVLTLERRHLDLKAGTLGLDPGTKNGEGRMVVLPDDVASLLAQRLARVDTLQRKLGRIVPFVFPHLTGRQRAGTRRSDFLGHGLHGDGRAWAPPSRPAAHGRPGHGARGSPLTVAMEIIAMYRRYAIVSEADHREAARKRSGIVSGIVGPRVVETRLASV